MATARRGTPRDGGVDPGPVDQVVGAAEHRGAEDGHRVPRDEDADAGGEESVPLPARVVLPGGDRSRFVDQELRGHRSPPQRASEGRGEHQPEGEESQVQQQPRSDSGRGRPTVAQDRHRRELGPAGEHENREPHGFDQRQTGLGCDDAEGQAERCYRGRDRGRLAEDRASGIAVTSVGVGVGVGRVVVAGLRRVRQRGRGHRRR